MRKGLKWLFDATALVLTAPAAVLDRVARLFSRSDEVFHGLSQLFSLVPGYPGDLLRKGFYRWSLQSCSRAVKISFGTVIAHPQTEIHEGAYIGPCCLIGTAVISRHATLGSAVQLLSGREQHSFDRLDVPVQQQGGRFVRIVVGPDSWIGNGAIVMADVGTQSIVGAGSVVTRPVEPRTVVAGNPARVLRSRSEERTGVHAVES